MANAKTRSMVLDSGPACNDAIAKVGDLRRQLARLETVMNDRLAGAKTEFAQAAQPIKVELAIWEKAIEDYAGQHRCTLTQEGKRKTVSFDAGEIVWRTKPPKVNIRNVEKALAWVLDAGARFRRFLRVTHELDKNAMLEDSALAGEIPGVRIKSDGESFEINPFETKLGEVA